MIKRLCLASLGTKTASSTTVNSRQLPLTALCRRSPGSCHQDRWYRSNRCHQDRWWITPAMISHWGNDYTRTYMRLCVQAKTGRKRSSWSCDDTQNLPPLQHDFKGCFWQIACVSQVRWRRRFLRPHCLPLWRCPGRRIIVRFYTEKTLIFTEKHWFSLKKHWFSYQKWRFHANKTMNFS